MPSLNHLLYIKSRVNQTPILRRFLKRPFSLSIMDNTYYYTSYCSLLSSISLNYNSHTSNKVKSANNPIIKGILIKSSSDSNDKSQRVFLDNQCILKDFKGLKSIIQTLTNLRAKTDFAYKPCEKILHRVYKESCFSKDMELNETTKSILFNNVIECKHNLVDICIYRLIDIHTEKELFNAFKEISQIKVYGRSGRKLKRYLKKSYHNQLTQREKGDENKK